MQRVISLLVAYTLLISCNPTIQETSRELKNESGVWLTNVDSDVLFSKESIYEAVDLIDEIGLSTIYIVVWNRGYTLYPSEVMNSTFGISIDPLLKGRDPLQELISYAHSKQIKVIAWFEFGFASSYDERDGGHILRAKPEWAARDSAGKIATKNKFQWMNALHPEVQNFISSLVLEVVSNYDIDGIQGDDRLPAMPSLAGYDSWTKEKYKNQIGAYPPSNYKDSVWVHWRADRLSDYLCKLYGEVKAINENVIVSMAPSIYHWSKYEYLQDWPNWLTNGCVDEVIPQIYRYDNDKYKKEVNKIVYEQVSSHNLNKVKAGVLLNVGDYIAADSLLTDMINIHRKAGISNEVYFFYEGVKKKKSFFTELYNTK